MRIFVFTRCSTGREMSTSRLVQTFEALSAACEELAVRWYVFGEVAVTELRILLGASRRLLSELFDRARRRAPYSCLGEQDPTETLAAEVVVSTERHAR